ncbi:Fur family transcriptional regulator [Acetonema longum]|uniref:Fur family ferric uptake regulator n=1 Tax=Acetonema longum DSM 6540 TaxID=1009370 RepID=F7NPM8_9FIRM|nr:Fur family ferric uptake regulator [Acetonema longum DSM 6540]
MSVSTKMKELRQKLRENQYKLTPQRQMVLQAFLDHPNRHLSAEDVYSIVRDQSPDIGLATVYRSLELLSEMNLLQKIDFGDGRSRYEVAESGATHHHHHLICLDCGQVKEYDDDLLEGLEASISRKHRFTIVDHEVKFYGYCSQCQAKRDHEG